MFTMRSKFFLIIKRNEFNEFNLKILYMQRF